MPDDVLTARDGHVATVTLNRPEKRNALTTGMIARLHAELEPLAADGDVRVVILRAEGNAFCAGLDLRELAEQRAAGVAETHTLEEALQVLEALPQPTIAAVQGDAVAGGCELALHCDLRVVSETARLGMPLARIGLVAPFPLAAKIVETVGPAWARQILLTGAPVDGRRAFEMGLVHQVAPPAGVEAAAEALARQVAGNAPLSLAGMKAAVLRAVALREQIPHADLDELARRARTSADASEGRRAMLDKRRPVFRGA